MFAHKCRFILLVDLLLTLSLLETRVISLCHQYRVRLACTSVQSDQALNVDWPNSEFSKTGNGQFKKMKNERFCLSISAGYGLIDFWTWCF